LSDQVKDSAVAVRAALELSGLDHGPISVHERMKRMGLPVVPSVASLARIFRERDVSRVEPKKKPRSSYRRFVYPAPNACWQLDAFEYPISGGRVRTILQVIDDHSRLAVASLVALSENAEAALAVVKTGIRRYGVPQRFLSDNGLAFNPNRRGFEGQLTAYLKALGVEPITGKPGKATTQGKNERFHQTLQQWLNARPLAETTAELQASVDEFDAYYNDERPHQALVDRMTPREAWNATEPVPAPRPKMVQPVFEFPATPVEVSWAAAAEDVDRTRVTKVRNDGTIRVSKVEFRIGSEYAGQQAYVIREVDAVEFFDHQGTSIVRCPWPPAGTHYVGTATLREHGLSPKS